VETKRPSCHESGHTIVGLSLGFHIAGIDVFEGRLRTICVDLDAQDKTDMDRFIFLAGGIAGEKVGIGNFDRSGCRDDQQKITDRGGKVIDTYLVDASRIIESSKARFEELKKQIVVKMITKSMEMAISGTGNSFRLISGDEIQRIWK
jgi:hypothetical protein